MSYFRKILGSPRWGFLWSGRWPIVMAIVMLPWLCHANDQTAIQAEKLFKAGQLLADKTYYLEALDLLEEAKDLLEVSALNQTAIYGDVLFALAQTKIKGRLHQDFSAYYVKTALQDVQTANKLREKLTDILPQKLAEGYFLEGYIHKKFFMRKDAAVSCFTRAVNIDPGSAAAKRELSELVGGEEEK